MNTQLSQMLSHMSRQIEIPSPRRGAPSLLEIAGRQVRLDVYAAALAHGQVTELVKVAVSPPLPEAIAEPRLADLGRIRRDLRTVRDAMPRDEGLADCLQDYLWDTDLVSETAHHAGQELAALRTRQRKARGLERDLVGAEAAVMAHCEARRQSIRADMEETQRQYDNLQRDALLNRMLNDTRGTLGTQV